MAIRYTTNWMGPVNYDWIQEHGADWSGGRIDVYGTGDDYPDELYLPVMKSQDWHRFSEWLRTLRTDTVWTLAQLVDQYEQTHPEITWWLGRQDLVGRGYLNKRSDI